MAKYPLPWSAHVTDREISSADDVFLVLDADEDVIVEVDVAGDYDQAERLTDLFAASPELLAACERAAKSLEWNLQWLSGDDAKQVQKDLDFVRAAIAKAKS